MAPAPKCVGREFVRQYYTVLNMAPQCLYRFYSTESSFTRGDDINPGEVIVGQAQIYKYVKNLDLEDSRAKILLIDTQPTLSDGIVIQVTGELSTNGGPMRRFMQTFVLMPQAENKYYVHNDIFRYQDQVFEDDLEGTESQEVEQVETEQPQVEEPVAQPAPLEDQYHQHVDQPQPLEHHHQPPPQQPAADMHSHLDSQHQQDYYSHQQMNGQMAPHEHEEMLHHMHNLQAQHQQPAEGTDIAHPEPVLENHEMASPVVENHEIEQEEPLHEPEEAEPEEEHTIADSGPVYEPEPVIQSPPKQEAKADPVVPAAPRSYAAFFKPSSAPQQNTPPQQPQFQQPEAQPQQSKPLDNYHQQPPQHTRGERRTSERRGGPPTTNGFRSQRGGPPSNEYMEGSNNSMEDDHWRNNGDDQQYRRSNPRPPKDYSQSYSQSSSYPYSDNCQVFVGNLPHHIDEDALRGIFQKYGAIAEVRINTGKSKMMMPGKNSGPTPNFGFVTFAEEGSVGKCLADKPITTADEHRLNVEEKKTRIGGGGFGGGRGGGIRQSGMGGGRGGGFNRMEGGGGGGRSMRGGYANGPPPRR